MATKNTFLFYDKNSRKAFVAKNVQGTYKNNPELMNELAKHNISDDSLKNGSVSVIKANKNYFQAPHQIMIELTKKCNFKCIYCCVDCEHNVCNNDLTHEEFIRLIEDIVKLKPNIVTFTGGEPFLREVTHNDLFDAMEILTNNGINCEIFTNGSLISRYADRIGKLNIHNLKVSIDTVIEAEMHKINQVIDQLENVKKGIEILTKNHISFSVNAVILKHNCDNIDKLMEYLSKQSIRTLVFIRALPRGGGERIQRNLLTNTEWEQFIDKISGLSKEYGFDMIDTGRQSCPCCNIFNTCAMCKAGISFMLIKQNGEVYPCGFATSKNMGNVKQKNVGEIWKDAVWNECRCNGVTCITKRKDVITLKKV